MSNAPALIVGLGNPGDEHARDRHNAGYWFVDELARRYGGNFKADKKLQGDTCQVSLGGQSLRLLKPTTYMNLSGQSVRQTLEYFKLTPADALVVHDDLDLPAGVARFKRGGGHGGNNAAWCNIAGRISCACASVLAIRGTRAALPRMYCGRPVRKNWR